MNTLEGKVVIVTGAAQGRGEAHARRLASEGARVVMTDLNADLGQQVADSIDGDVVFVAHDVTDPASWQQVVETARATFGVPDVLVNNAGYAGPEVKAAGFQHKPGTPNLAYTSAKFAVRGMSKAVAAEYGPNNIRVNSVHPGGILTKMLIDTVPEDLRNQIAAASIPMQRFGQPDKISSVVVFLASDASSYVSGTEIVADGGQLAI